jgi:hypothetical protein
MVSWFNSAKYIYKSIWFRVQFARVLRMGIIILNFSLIFERISQQLGHFAQLIGDQLEARKF